MATEQWIRHINRLCEIRNNPRLHNMLIGLVVDFHRLGECSLERGNWLVNQLKFHFRETIGHSGAIFLTTAQRREIKEAVGLALSEADAAQLSFLRNTFSHIPNRYFTSLAHKGHKKGGNLSLSSNGCDTAIARLLLKLIDGPLPHSRPSATPDFFSSDLVNGGSPAARHLGEEEANSPLGMHANVNDDAASPLRGFAAKSDEPLEGKGEPLGGEANSANQAMTKPKSRQVDAHASKATISLWVNGGSKSSVTAILEVGKEKLRLNFVAPRKAQKLSYITEHGGEEEREWLAELTAKTDAAARQLSGTLGGRHVMSAIHHETDTACRETGVANGVALLVCNDDTPASCCVVLDDRALHFGLDPFNGPSARSPQFKKTIVL